MNTATRQFTPLPTPSEYEPFPRKLRLECGACGKSGDYAVGRVLVPPKGSAREEGYSFSGVFYCHACGAGGPWELTPRALMVLTQALFAVGRGEELVGILQGTLLTFDKRRVRYGSEAVAHLRDLLAAEPESAFLWTRLGNTYKHGGCAHEAEEAYRRAVELAPEDAEAHSCLAEILTETRRKEAAVPHWKAVLQYARHATRLPRELRMDMVSCALDCLLSTVTDPNEAFALLPTGVPPERGAAQDPAEPLVVELRTWNLANPRDWEQICAVFIGERLQPRWPKLAQRVRAANRPSSPQPRAAAGVARNRTAAGRNSTTTARESRPTLSAAAEPDYDPRVPRNAPCPCGSGHKYKKCCGVVHAGG